MTTTTTILLDKYYGIAALAAVGIGAQCFFTPMFTATGLRRQLFSDEFMKREFGDIHKKETGYEAPRLGYPDQGFGRYSDKLSYKDWYRFASAQRAHGNFFEQVGIVIPMILIGGCEDGRIAGALGWAYFIGRIMYSLGYAGEKGSEGRTIGGTVITFSMIGLIALALKASWRWVSRLF
jgi:uncharacterized membrane protein YecN with MAPEG domain